MPSLIATLGANIAPFLQNLDTAKSEAKKKGEGIGSALGEELNSKLSGFIGAAAIEETIRRTIEYGKHIEDLSNRLGISTDAAQQWDFALKRNGSSLDAAATFFEKLAINRDKAMKGGDSQIAAFEKLGVSMEKLKTLRIEDVAAVIAQGFEEGDPQALVSALREVGGRGAGEMISTFRDGFAELAGEAPLISPDDIHALSKASDAIAELKAEFQSSVAPFVAGIAEAALFAIDYARAALAIPIGALKGVIEGLQRAYASDGFFGAVGHLLDFGKAGSRADAFSGVAEAEDALSEQRVDRDMAADEKRKRLAKGHATELEDADAKAAKKSADEERKVDEQRAKSADRVQKINEEIAEIQRKASMDGMTADQKRVALAEEIAKLHRERDPYGEATDEENALKDQEIAQRESELRGIKNDTGGASRRDYQANELQRIGGFLGTYAAAPELAMLDVQKKSEQHLSKIEKGIERLITTTVSGPSEFGDTEF